MKRNVVSLICWLSFAVLMVSGCSKNLETTAPAGRNTADKGAAPKTEATADADDLVFAIVQSNDVHGYILPRRLFAYIAEKKKSPQGYPLEIGGVEWFKGYLDILAQHYGDRMVLLDGGDMFQGTMISNQFEGATVVRAMERLGYAAAAVGNHEFDYGADGAEAEGKDPLGALKARGKQASFPFLTANLVSKETGEVVDWEGFAPYTIIEREGVKIGIIGGTTVDTPNISKPHVAEKLEFRPLSEGLKKFAPIVREQGAQIVIGLLHAGGKCEDWENPEDQSTCDIHEELWEVANELEPGTVDLLVGGHTHSFVFHKVNGVPIMESGAKGTAFGLARIHYSKKQKKVTLVEMQRPVPVCHYFFKGEDSCVFFDHLPNPEKVPATFLGQQVKKSPFLDEIFTAEHKRVLEESTALLGPEAVANLDKLDGTDHPMGMLVNQVLLDTYPKASIAIFNESGLRASIIAGKISVEDVFQVFPFDSKPAYVTVTGQQLSDLLRISASGAHGGPVVRGLRLDIDRMADECIAEDWNKDGVKEDWERKLLLSATLEDGSPIAPEAEYTFVTTSYLAAGGSDFKRVLKNVSQDKIQLLQEEPSIRDVVMQWMRKNPVKLGGPNDPITRGTGGLYVKIKNPDHVPGTTCPVENSSKKTHNM